MRWKKRWPIILLLASAQLSVAQIPTGTLFGRVTDPSGGAIPSVAILATNGATGQIRKATTDSNGDYTLPQLTPGGYSVEASAPNFTKAVRTDIHLEVNARVEIDFSLQIGSVTEKVNVSAAAAQVETGSSSLDQTITTRQALEMPLLGRNFVQLASLSAGATPVIFGQQDEGSSTSKKTLSVNVAGGRGNWNSWLIDGVEVKNPWFNTPSVQPSVDAIEEFKVMRGTFSAEYGNATAVMNIATKSGSNSFHGTAFEFLRNNILDARNFFAPTKGAYRYNQFGRNLSGSVIRNRTFFFAYYEGLRSTQQSPIVATVPSPAQLGGNLSGLAPAIIDPVSRV